MAKNDRFRVRPLWIALVFLVFALVLGIDSLFGSAEVAFISNRVRSKMMILCIPFCIYYIPRCIWGYGLDRDYFTVYILWFPVQRIPWDDVSQVICVHLEEAVQKKSTARKVTYICVTIKPADPVPFFYRKELGQHWRRNIFLVWNLYFTNPEKGCTACIKAFEALGKTVEHRDYDY